MIDDIYNVCIFEFVGNILCFGSFEDVDVSVMVYLKFCGFKVCVFLKVEDGKVVDFVYDVKVCVFG